MARAVVSAAIIIGIGGVAAAAVSYVTSRTEVSDLRLIAIEAAQLKDVSALYGQAPPDTPVFRVRFSTRSDLVALANGLDAYTIRNRVLVDAGCNPDLRTFSYTSVALMLLDFTRVFDAKGAIEGRGLRASDESDEYVLHFGVVRRQWSEFVTSGLDEAPLCFSLTGESRTGRALSTNIVPLPKEALGEAAAGFDG